MIKQYNDHAANERTYLAWLRTGIAIIAFGFVLERFDIFLHTIVKTLGSGTVHEVSHGGREAGVALVAVGLVTLAVATWRFALTSRKISAEQTIIYSPRSALWLGALIIALGLFVLAYVTRLLFATT
jgi:putative membrane protein